MRLFVGPPEHVYESSRRVYPVKQSREYPEEEQSPSTPSHCAVSREPPAAAAFWCRHEVYACVFVCVYVRVVRVVRA